MRERERERERENDKARTKKIYIFANIQNNCFCTALRYLDPFGP